MCRCGPGQAGLGQESDQGEAQDLPGNATPCCPLAQGGRLSLFLCTCHSFHGSPDAQTQSFCGIQAAEPVLQVS